MSEEALKQYDKLSADELIALLSPGELIEYLIYSYGENPDDFDIAGIKRNLILKIFSNEKG